MKLTKLEKLELEELAAAYQEHKQMGSEWNDGFYEGIKFAVEYVEKLKPNIIKIEEGKTYWIKCDKNTSQIEIEQLINKLTKLQINEGDMLMIGHGTELSVLIEMKNGALIISGPYNKNSQTFEITTKGVTSLTTRTKQDPEPLDLSILDKTTHIKRVKEYKTIMDTD